MDHHKINFTAVQGTTSHHLQVIGLLNSLLPVSRKRSRHRRLLYSSNFELLKKLHALNLLSYTETILPMIDLAKQPAP